MTVPSCAAHNNGNSKDVEYTRGILVSAARLGPESEPVFKKLMRSFDRAPSLIERTYPDLRQIHYRGGETATFSVDLKRVTRVMTAIAQALHYRDFQIKIRRWEMFCPSFHTETSLSGAPDPWEPLRRTTLKPHYDYQPTEQPEVFHYGRAGLGERRWVYQFVFYGAVIVNAWPSRRI